jgi:hypothetical protein
LTCSWCHRPVGGPHRRPNPVPGLPRSRAAATSVADASPRDIAFQASTVNEKRALVEQRAGGIKESPGSILGFHRTNNVLCWVEMPRGLGRFSTCFLRPLSTRVSLSPGRAGSTSSCSNPACQRRIGLLEVRPAAMGRHGHNEIQLLSVNRQQLRGASYCG